MATSTYEKLCMALMLAAVRNHDDVIENTVNELTEEEIDKLKRAHHLIGESLGVN